VAEKPAAEKPAAEKPAAPKAEGEKLAKAEAEAPAAKPKSSGKAGGKAGDEKAADAEEAYRLLFKSTPIGAEVLIDGDYFGRTPCERRILDPKKS